MASAVLYAAAIGGMQWAGGAYEAEFCGASDEAAHFVTSLMVRDYAGLWPHPDPMPWASAYYIHYPKVAFGHWPPAYFFAQAAWWIAFPPSRASAMWFNAAVALAATLVFLSLARRIRGGWPAAAAGLLLLAAPVVQQSLAQTMSDLLSLLGGLLLAVALVRVAEAPSGRGLAAVCLAVIFTVLTKATGVALAPGAALVLLHARFWRAVRTPVLIAAAAALVPVAGWFVWQNGTGSNISRWGGLNLALPWRIDLLPELAGPGLLLLAVAGAWLGRKQPAVRVAAALALGMIFTSYFVRAMREPRHWIVALPLILLLALAAIAWLENALAESNRAESVSERSSPPGPARSEFARGRAPAAAAALAAIALFPWEFYRQSELGFAALADRVQKPGRMLVSSPAGWPEGCWVASVAAIESRPASTIFRATKLLAETTWYGQRYQLLTPTPAEVERRLDEARIDTVVLHSGEPRLFAHHAVLEQTVRASENWRACGASGEVEAFCRATPPRFPAKPVEINLRQHLGRSISEPLIAGPPAVP